MQYRNDVSDHIGSNPCGVQRNKLIVFSKDFIFRSGLISCTNSTTLLMHFSEKGKNSNHALHMSDVADNWTRNGTMMFASFISTISLFS